METQEREALFKEAMGNYPTGVTIITSVNEEGKPIGLTVNSFASVSLNPTLVLWSIDHRVTSLEAFKNAKGFAVHILSGNQQALCDIFAKKGEERFEKSEWKMSERNLPILANAFAVLECDTFQLIEAGDHTILIGEVKDIQIARENEPMLYHRRKFGPIPADFYSDK